MTDGILSFTNTSLWQTNEGSFNIKSFKNSLSFGLMTLSEFSRYLVIEVFFQDSIFKYSYIISGKISKQRLLSPRSLITRTTETVFVASYGHIKKFKRQKASEMCFLFPSEFWS